MDRCSHCDKAPSSLKQCVKCMSVSYCDRDCQRAHWETHKQDCSRLTTKRLGTAADPASVPSGSGSTPSGSGSTPNGTAHSNAAGGPDAAPFTAIHGDTFLHGRSEEETFQLLIDCLRMRQEDEYSIDRVNMGGSIYSSGNDGTSQKAFRVFMHRAQRVSGLLPPWWTDAKTDECV